MGWFSKLFSKTEPVAKEHEASAYKGLLIQPCPKKKQGGWSTEAIIRKEGVDDSPQHHFIRADTSPTEDAAIELINHKCQVLIDQLGEGLFR